MVLSKRVSRVASPGGLWQATSSFEPSRRDYVPVTTNVDSCNTGVGSVQLIAYYRVSTARQGASGLGLEAQRAKVQQLAAERGAEVVAEFAEVESGRRTDRPQLAAALAEARKLKAVVAVAKLDRIARDAELLLRLTPPLPGKLTPLHSGHFFHQGA